MTQRPDGIKTALLFLKDDPDREVFVVNKVSAARNLCEAGFLAIAFPDKISSHGLKSKFDRNQTWPELAPYRFAIWPRNSYGGYYFAERAYNILVTSGVKKKAIRIIKPFGPFGTEALSSIGPPNRFTYNDPATFDKTMIQNYLAGGENMTIRELRKVTIPARVKRWERLQRSYTLKEMKRLGISSENLEI